MIKITRVIINLSVLAGLMAACRSAPVTQDTNLALTAAFETAVAQIGVPSDTPAPTETPVPTPTIPRTPPALPATFQSSLLKQDSQPRMYIADTCQYLQNKWNPNNAAPGTVVMPIMFHGIAKDAVSNDPKAITANDFQKLMNDLYEMGFQAINMQQMADFLYQNSFIPNRSVLLIVDDRHFAEYFNDHFRSYHEQWGWPVVNAYIGLDERPDLWSENAALSAEGWVDYQAHGYIHNINITNSSTDEFIMSEMGGAITSLQKYMNKVPIAYIWPGGGFSPRAVELAPQLGYRLGFTVNPRGPVMYNWIPQAETSSQSNSLEIPEAPAQNPLMTLPRYWSVNARGELDTVRQIGEQATQFAGQNKATELEYYDIVCAPVIGPIPDLPR